MRDFITSELYEHVVLAKLGVGTTQEYEMSDLG